MPSQVATDHVEMAKNSLARSKAYLDEGDLHQASEKGWGAASHMAQPVAAENNWPYEHHDQFDSVIVNARQPLPLGDNCREYGKAAHILHQNHYQHPSLLNPDTIREDIDDVERLLTALEPHIVQPSPQPTIEAPATTSRSFLIKAVRLPEAPDTARDHEQAAKATGARTSNRKRYCPKPLDRDAMGETTIHATSEA